MPEIDLRQSGFKCSACGPFSKKQKKEWKKLGNMRFKIYLSKQLR